MELSIKQKNELFTGIVLAQELKATLEQTRRFITVRSFESCDNKVKVWSKVLPTSYDDLNAVFAVRVYSIKSEYINLDVDERDCSEHEYIGDIDSFEALYLVLKNYIDDFSGLIPQWNVDNPIE